VGLLSFVIPTATIAASWHARQSRHSPGRSVAGAHRASGKSGETFRGNRFSAWADRRRLYKCPIQGRVRGRKHRRTCWDSWFRSRTFSNDFRSPPFLTDRAISA